MRSTDDSTHERNPSCWRRALQMLALRLWLVAIVCPAPAAEAAPVLQRVALSGYPFGVYANHDLAGDLTSITAVVLVFHGLQRDGDAYFEAAETLAKNAGVDAATTLIVAPNFFDEVDEGKRSDLQGLPLWHNTGWMEGEVSVKGPKVSSYGAIDDLLVRLTDRTRAPHLERIVIAGHSGGGQWVDRYAVFNHADRRIMALGIDISYVIANPSSYLYFTPDRPDGTSFAPYSRLTCPDYDHYRYGMEDLVPYAQDVTGAEAFAAFKGRHVTFLFGSEDTDPNQRVLDKKCGAEAEGATRYERGHSFWRYEHWLNHGSAGLTHQAFDVIGVGHDQARMLGSECGSVLLFQVQFKSATTAPCRRVEAPS